MDAELVKQVVLWALASLGPAGLAVVYLALFPHQAEKLGALILKVLSATGLGIFRFAQRQYVRYDLQARVNEFVRQVSKRIPGVETAKLSLELVAEGDRDSFLREGQVVIRLRRDDPQELNFVHGAYHFVSRSLLFRAKRYLSPSQKEAIDLYVTTDLFRREKPSVVQHFLDEYLHPRMEDKKSKRAKYFEAFDKINEERLFYPVLVQELEFLGRKVFGGRRDDLIVSEVNELCEFLVPIAERQVGDTGDLNFDRTYCRFGLVIVGKPSKMLVSLDPYVGYIRRCLVANGIESIYVLSLWENRGAVREIVSGFLDEYDVHRRHKLERTLRYKDRKVKRQQCLYVLRKKGVPIYQRRQ